MAGPLGRFSIDSYRLSVLHSRVKENKIFGDGKDVFHRVPNFARKEWDAVERVLTTVRGAAGRSRNRRQEGLTAEYAENRLPPGSPSAYSAYSAVYLLPVIGRGVSPTVFIRGGRVERRPS